LRIFQMTVQTSKTVSASTKNAPAKGKKHVALIAPASDLLTQSVAVAPIAPVAVAPVAVAPVAPVADPTPIAPVPVIPALSPGMTDAMCRAETVAYLESRNAPVAPVADPTPIAPVAVAPVAPVADPTPIAPVAVAPVAPVADPTPIAPVAPVADLETRVLDYANARPTEKHNADSVSLALGIPKDLTAESDWRHITGILAARTRRINSGTMDASGNVTGTGTGNAKTAIATNSDFVSTIVTADDCAILATLETQYDWTIYRTGGILKLFASLASTSEYMRVSARASIAKELDAQRSQMDAQRAELDALRAELLAMRNAK
jgi:hypothetical protein